MRGQERGFTLVELMVSIALMSFVLLTSVMVLSEARKMTQEARYRLHATNTARSVLEMIKDTPLNLVSAINTNNFVSPGLPGAVVTIITNPANLAATNLATVTVRVTWVDPKGRQGRLEVSTMRSRF